MSSLTGHSEAVSSVAITADGKHIVSGSYDGTVKIWSFEERKEVATLPSHGKGVNSVAITTDTKHIISASRGGIVAIWSFEDKKEVDSFTVVSDFPYRTLIALLPDKKHIVVRSPLTVKIWSIKERKVVGSLNDPITAIAVSTNGKYIFTGGGNSTVKIWSFEERKEIASLTGHSGRVDAIAVTKDGKHIVSASQDGSVRIWPFEEGKEVVILKSDSYVVTSLVVTIDGKHIVSGSNERTLIIWSLEERKQVGVLIGHRSLIGCVAISPDQQYIVSGSVDQTVKVWSFSERQEVASVEVGDVCNTVAVTADGKHVIWGLGNNTIGIWSFAEWGKVASLTGHNGEITSIAVTAKCEHIVSGSSDKTVRIWSLKERKQIGLLTGHTETVNSIVLTTDGKFIISGSSDGTVRVWLFSEKKTVACLFGDKKQEVRSAAVTKNGKYIISKTSIGTVEIWLFEEQKLVSILTGPRRSFGSVALTSDEVYIVASFGPNIHLFPFFPEICLLEQSPSLALPLNPCSKIFQANISNWITGKDIANCVSHWSLQPESINALHIYAYFNHANKLESALQYGTPFMKSSFGSPVTLALQRSTMACLDALLKYLEIRIHKEQSEAWYPVFIITDDLPGILRSESSYVHPFIKRLLCSPVCQSIPSMLAPKSPLPIVVTPQYRLIDLADFRTDTDSKEGEVAVKFFLSLVKWNTAFGSSASLQLLSALRESGTRKILRTPYVKTLLELKWRNAKFLCIGFTCCYALLLVNLVCIIFRYWRLEVLCSFFFLLNALFLLTEAAQWLGSRTEYLLEVWNWVDVLRGTVSIVWAALALSHYDNQYLTLTVVALCFLRGFTYFLCTKVTRVLVFLTMEVIKEMYIFSSFLHFLCLLSD